MLEYFIIVKLLSEHHLEFLSLKGGCRGSSESKLVKMPHCWKSHVTAQLCLFADDTSLFIILDNVPYAAACLNLDVDQIARLAATWLVFFNPSKTEVLLLSRKLNTIQHPPLFNMENVQIQEVKSHKHLGLYLSSDCSWYQHKLNVKHVLKSAPLPASLHHSAKQYNLKIFHAVFPSLFVCIVSFSNCCFFSILILRNYFLLIFIALLCILTL